MNDNELKARLLITVRDCVVLLGTAATIVALFYMSRSWHSLWAMLLLVLFSIYKNVPVRPGQPGNAAPSATEQES